MKTHTVTLRVTYKDTDQMGVAYYSNYLVWFEIARTEFFREIGMEYRRLEKEDKIFLPVAEANCRYKAPLRYDDVFTVITKVEDLGSTRLSFSYEIQKDGKTTTTGYTKHAFVNSDGRPVPVPEKVRTALS